MVDKCELNIKKYQQTAIFREKAVALGYLWAREIKLSWFDCLYLHAINVVLSDCKSYQGQNFVFKKKPQYNSLIIILWSLHQSKTQFIAIT